MRVFENNKFIAGFSLDYQNVNKYRNNSISRIRSFNGIANERNLFEIFFKPKLKIEFDKNQLGSYKPELNIVDKNADKTGIKRKWLKIKIRNKGSATAINCRAKIHVIEGDSSKPTDTKRLIWDEFASTMDIYPKDDGEFCHVVFSDTNFPENIACMISSEQAEKNPESSAQNGLGAGKYKIQITVTAENQASISKTFTLFVGDNDFF